MNQSEQEQSPDSVEAANSAKEVSDEALLRAAGMAGPHTQDFQCGAYPTQRC
jgi:hypothetical protein